MDRKFFNTLCSIAVLMLLMFSSSALTSCDKDDDKDITSLNGTRWKGSDDVATVTISFSDSTCKVYAKENSISGNYDCTYTYDAEEKEGFVYFNEEVLYYFSITGHSMDLYDEDKAYLVTIYKQ